MENEKSKGSPQYSEVFKEAIERLPDVKAFVEVAAGALDDIGSDALRTWYKKEAETKSDDDISKVINSIIVGGCYDEHEFRHKLSEACPETFCETERSGESCTARRNPSSENTHKEKLNTFESIFDEWDKRDSFCSELEKFRDEIEIEVKASTFATHANFVVIRGDRLTGKSRLLKSIISRMTTGNNKVIPVAFRDAMNRGDRAFGGDNRRYLVTCDDFDIELLENAPAMELRIQRILQSTKVTFLVTMNDTAKLSTLRNITHIYEMPELSVVSVAENLADHMIKDCRLSLETSTKLVNFLSMHSPTTSLQENGLHALRLVMYKQLNAKDTPKSGELVVADSDLQEAVEKVLGISFKLESAEECRKQIESEIIGQRLTIDRIVPFLDIIHSGFSDPEKSLGIFLFYGPSGVGKTELAKVIANSMFGGRYYKEDMNTYSERHSVSRLIGSPPGYIGHGDSSALMKFIDKEPSGVILLDEIEKAHQDVREALMELMDTGFMRDAAGRQHDARRFLIIMTSNVSLREKNFTASIGFAKKEKDAAEEVIAATNDKEDREYLIKEGTFTKELIGRIQLVSKFSMFTDNEKTEVAKRLVVLTAKRLKKFLENKGKVLSDDDITVYANEALSYYSEATGARGMKTYIDTTITSKILGIVKS